MFAILTKIIKKVFILKTTIYVTEFTITSHPTLSRPIVDSFINDAQKEIDYYNQHSLGRIYKAILQMEIFKTRRKFIINSWIGTDFDRGRYKFYDSIYAIEDARIRAGEILLNALRENSVKLEIYQNIAFLLNKLQDRAAIIKLIISELKAEKISNEEFFEKIEKIYFFNPTQNITDDILNILKNSKIKILDSFYVFIKTYGLDLAQGRHFRVDGELLTKKLLIDKNILQTIALFVNNSEKIAIIIANSTNINQIKELATQYGKNPLPRIIPLIENYNAVEYFIDNYEKIKIYLGKEKEIMLAGSDMTKSEGFFGAQYAFYKLISQIKAKDPEIKIFFGSGTTIFRTGGQLQISRLRHLTMNAFSQNSLFCYNQTLQGGGISFEGMADISVMDFIRNYSKTRKKPDRKIFFNNRTIQNLSNIAEVARNNFFKKYGDDFNNLISTETELTNFGISIMNDFGGSRDSIKTAFVDYLSKSRAIQFYTCFLNLGIAPIALEIPDNYNEFSNIIKESVKNNDISTNLLLTSAAIQLSYSDERYAKANDINTNTPFFLDMQNKMKVLNDILDITGYNIENKNLLNIIAEEWRIDNFQKLKDSQKIAEIQFRKDIIFRLFALRSKVVKHNHLKGTIEIIKYINFTVNDVKINGMNKQVEYLMKYIEERLAKNDNFEDHFIPYSCYGLNRIIPYKN